MRFRVTDRKFLRCVARIWWQSIAHLPRSSCEDTITVALVDGLSKDAEARGGFYCEYQFYPFARSPRGPLTGTSRVDLAVIVGHDRAAYLAYECKRLNVTGADGARRSQAGTYVGGDGMMRFVTEKYAEDLPVGCMMGYVMDGDLDFARERIRAAMTGSRVVLGQQGDLRAQDPIGRFQRFATDHVSGGKSIEILHALLPFVNGPDGPDAEGGKGEECGVARHKAAAMGAPRRGWSGVAASDAKQRGHAFLQDTFLQNSLRHCQQYASIMISTRKVSGHGQRNRTQHRRRRGCLPQSASEGQPPVPRG